MEQEVLFTAEAARQISADHHNGLDIIIEHIKREARTGADYLIWDKDIVDKVKERLTGKGFTISSNRKGQMIPNNCVEISWKENKNKQ